MPGRNKVAVSIATFSLGAFMGLSTGMAGAANGPTGFEGQPGNQAGQQGGSPGGSKVCSPGQQGNPAPGFKPGGCKK